MRDAGRRPRVLVVDDHVSLAEALSEELVDAGYDVTAKYSGNEAVQELEKASFDALVTDLRMPDLDGLALLARARAIDPDRPVIVMTAYSAVDSAIESIRRGAYHYLTKPFKPAELVLFLGRALDEAKLRTEADGLRRALRDRFGLENLIGRNEGMERVCELIQRVADARVPVLILGETGTGKGIVARAIHAHGPRAAAPFVTVNCAALPESLLESELFGHVRGAFTGAISNRVGLLETASRGTLFLDEIAEMTPALQAKLLHVLESGTVRSVGANTERAMDTRIVTATHRNLRERVAEGTFREDLFYRLDVVTIEVPALRHRKDDLPLLIEHFLARSRGKHPSSPVERFSPDALEKLLAHAWPGNVRELEHVIERCVLLGRERQVSASDLPFGLQARQSLSTTFRGEVVPLRDVQRRYAAWAYEQLGGKKVLTAEKLDIDFRTLSKLLATTSDEASSPSRDEGDASEAVRAIDAAKR